MAPANKYKVPRLAFVNKMDRTGADFFKVYDQMKARLRRTRCRCRCQSALKKTSGVIDLVRMKAIFWDEAAGHEVRSP